MRQLPVSLVVAAVFQIAAATVSTAAPPPSISPNVEALTAVCVGDAYIVSFRSWASDSFENPQIDILFNGTKVGEGAFTIANNFQFTGSAAAPGGPGSTLVVSAVAVGAWSNGAPGGQQASIEYVLPSEPCGVRALGRFTGGGKQIDLGVAKVTRGLTIHCDLLLSNNLEINWGGGENFHMTRHTVARCSDDPDIDQRPPVAPLDRMDGEGTGRYNNQDGYTVHFTMIDAGEPGRDDQMAILIFETSNPSNVVLNVLLQPLVGGNLQAHYDQPHKK